ncbi:MAG: phenylalanine--tRNA ligase subunit alpha [Tissierellia bacterium]|nr:phenylalanine--tRNA ligase subunit alpha [Tissierellia bacterium]
MLGKLEELFESAKKDIEAVKSRDDIDKLSHELMGKKGSLTEILKGLGKLGPEEKKTVGKRANEIKRELTDLMDRKQDDLLASASAVAGLVDLSLPGKPVIRGGLHPITQMCYDLNDAFMSQGFELYRERDISSEKYAFDALNFPPDHPARESMDTYWIEGTEHERGAKRLALRPHLTGASVRYLLEHGAPARFIYPGEVFRNESTDARHERAFFQYEALIVDKDFSFSSGKVLVDTILQKVFGYEVRTRMRTGFFPFVEPGFEIDMECQVCKGEGCRVCKNVGWIEVMPGGSPHPNVLRAANIDPDVYSGFYVNIGLDRMVMMRYGIDDVRFFRSTDLRFLNQFK